MIVHVRRDPGCVESLPHAHAIARVCVSVVFVGVRHCMCRMCSRRVRLPILTNRVTIRSRHQSSRRSLRGLARGRARMRRNRNRNRPRGYTMHTRLCVASHTRAAMYHDRPRCTDKHACVALLHLHSHAHMSTRRDQAHSLEPLLIARRNHALRWKPFQYLLGTTSRNCLRKCSIV